MGLISEKIKKAIFGGEVRDAIAEGIEATELLRDDYEKQVINAGNSNAEIVDARGAHIKLKDRLDSVDESLKDITTDLKDITTDLADIPNNRIDNLVVAGAGISPTALHFDVVNINRTQNMTIPVYDNDFKYNIDNAYEQEVDTVTTHAQAKYVWSQGQLSFNCIGTPNVTYSPQEAYVKTPISFKTGNFMCELDVKTDKETADGTGTSLRVGVLYNIDNFCVANYDRSNMKMQIVGKYNGVVFGSDLVYQSIATPYTLIMSVNNDTVSMIIKKDGVYKSIGEVWVGGTISFNNVGLLNEWKLCCGFRASYATGDMVITGLRGNYSSGMSVGADYHVLTYEDGCLVKNNNAIYFTASIHNTIALQGGASGISIYKLDLNSYKLEFVGQLHFKGTDTTYYFGGGSSKIFYDRNLRAWVCQVTNFKVTPIKTYIGLTKVNLLSGIHVITLQPMNIPDTTIATWDFDIIYDKSVNKYRCAYAKGTSGGITLCEATDVLGAWIKVTDNLPIGGEGNMFFKCNGKYYISKTNLNNLGLDILSYPDLTVLGTTTVSKWCNKVGNTPLSWGQILALNNGDKTSFYMIVFSGNKFGGNNYGYGDLWIYKAREEETGIEFLENNILSF